MDSKTLQTYLPHTILALLGAACFFACPGAFGKVLQGGVEENSSMTAPHRSVVRPPQTQFDLFDSDEETAPPIVRESARPPQSPSIEQAEQAPPAWSGASQNPELGFVPPQFFPQQPSQDPDQTPEMQLAWDAWHHHIAEAIFTRFNFFAKTAFKNSPPLECRVVYVVTRSGNVTNVNVLQPSSNMMFNVLVLTVIKSFNGDRALLQFPTGSQRDSVQKTADFSKNLSGIQGFRYTTGDREHVSQ